VWTGDVISGKLWNHVTYQREYHFWLDFGSISHDGITVEQATPEKSQCFGPKSDLPYSVHLNFTNGTPPISRFQVSNHTAATATIPLRSQTLPSARAAAGQDPGPEYSWPR
jgi:hypothetical protein